MYRFEITVGATPRRRSVRSLVCALVVCAVIAVAPATALAEAGAGQISKEAGLGGASAISSLIYAPLKVVYAVTGLVVGGLAWCFSGGDSEVAKVVLVPSVLGDYVVTPSHLTGERSLEFFGREPGYGSSTADVASAQDDWDEGW